MTSKKEKSLLDTVVTTLEEEGAEKSQETEVLDPLSDLLALIHDSGIRALVESVFYRVHKYRSQGGSAFWDSPAALTPGQHPPDEYESDGMLIHTRRVTKIAVCMACSVGYPQPELDILIAAALMHDVTKAIFATENLSISHDSLHAYTIDSFMEFMRSDDHEHGRDTLSHTLNVDFESMLKILRVIHCSHGILSTIQETFPVAESEKILAMADYLAGNLHVVFPELFGLTEEEVMENDR